MAGIIRNGLVSAARRLINPPAIQSVASKAPHTILLQSNNGLLYTNTVTRSLWVLSSRNDAITKARGVNVNRHSLNCKCGCKSYATEVDASLSSFLEEEIRLENDKLVSQLPQFKEFKVVSTNGGEVKLERKKGNETITIKFNVNASVDSAGPSEEGEEEEMISRPDFQVDVNKGDGKVLSLYCLFPNYLHEETVKDDVEDLFEIQSVQIHDGDVTDSVYSAQAENLDAELYELFMDLLDDRGINSDFICELIDFATGYEQQQYVKFLKDVKSFVNTK